jgi:hypothetical protein
MEATVQTEPTTLNDLWLLDPFPDKNTFDIVAHLTNLRIFYEVLKKAEDPVEEKEVMMDYVGFVHRYSRSVTDVIFFEHYKVFFNTEERRKILEKFDSPYHKSERLRIDTQSIKPIKSHVGLEYTTREFDAAYKGVCKVEQKFKKLCDEIGSYERWIHSKDEQETNLITEKILESKKITPRVLTGKFADETITIKYVPSGYNEEIVALNVESHEKSHPYKISVRFDIASGVPKLVQPTVGNELLGQEAFQRFFYILPPEGLFVRDDRTEHEWRTQWPSSR